MKIILVIFCWVMALYSLWFPFSYFHKDADKKEIKVSHILVEDVEKAQNIKAEIRNGKSFEDMAEEHSLCPSKEKKGDLGYVARGMMIPEFEKAVFSLKENIISEPVQTREGWHLIKIYDVKYFSDKENFEKNNLVYKFLSKKDIIFRFITKSK